MAIHNLGCNRLSDVDSAKQFELGETFKVSTSWGNKVYEYIEYESATGAVTCHAGQVIVPYSTSSSVDFTQHKYTGDITDTIISACRYAAVAQGSLTDGTFGWVLRKGKAKIEVGTTSGTTITYGQSVMAGLLDKSVDAHPTAATTDGVNILLQVNYQAAVFAVCTKAIGNTAVSTTGWIDLIGYGV